MGAPPPVQGKFELDPRAHIDKTTGKWQYEDEDTGQEFEWTGKAWIPLLDDDLIQAQQSAYAVKGVDENGSCAWTPAAPVLAREERIKKRKAGERDGPRETRPRPQGSTLKKTAVFVSNLPPNTTNELLESVFSKAGVLHLDDDGQPRIKMYYDEAGTFKGEALVMYFKEGSVDLAITLLDDTELELGAGYGNMRVRVAEYDRSKPASTEDGAPSSRQPASSDKKSLSAEAKQRMSKRMRTLESKLKWHSDEDDDESVLDRGQKRNTTSGFARVVVLKGMFAPENLRQDPALLLELKEDVREEAETIGVVTSVTLYDKERDGVITIKFKDPEAALACVTRMNGRYFDGRRISASIYNGREKFERSGGMAYDDDAEEQERLDKFAKWLLETEE